MGKDKIRARSRSSTAFDLAPGDAGFLFTCWQGREKQCASEALALLSRYVDPAEPESQSEPLRPGLKRKLVCDSLQEELLALSRSYSEAGSMHALQRVKMGDLSCLIFLKLRTVIHAGAYAHPGAAVIRTEATALCYQIWSDMLSSGAEGTRACQRMIPIEGTCYANIKALTALVEELLDAHADYFGSRDHVETNAEKEEERERFSPSHLVPFEIVYQSRYNDSLSRELVTGHLAPLILSRSPSRNLFSSLPMQQNASLGRFYVDLGGTAKISLMVQVMKNIAGVSVLRDYATIYKKGNLMMMNDAFVDQACVLPLGKEPLHLSYD